MRPATGLDDKAWWAGLGLFPAGLKLQGSAEDVPPASSLAEPAVWTNTEALGGAAGECASTARALCDSGKKAETAPAAAAHV